ncbi:hypothetical protein A3H66_02690 [Candidatus Falkowbacteria bacterium RIFCSPLOWO2_02_FULL_45_21]|uniref:Uncharacterized protein n=1 Tax=Candidatus Falkowbacteria bacterium RIFCSPLOWO2_02_FULL_45_21 TaxID=1797989 RepID=A0A1F5SBY8_9BACT|nr:MAG: hypothetical protein A3H66_02690 [Candidatus Falkowbacteria bacterium RIFCSPLOWO2_02_FULL_45_21]
MCFGLRGIHPFNSPSALQPKTEKEILKFFKTSFFIRKQKKRNTSANGVYLVTAFIQKPPPYFAPKS